MLVFAAAISPFSFSNSFRTDLPRFLFQTDSRTDFPRFLFPVPADSFSHLVERFACLYTSHVGNLLAYSPLKSYRSKEDTMPHESGW